MNLLIVEDNKQMRQMIKSVVNDLAEHTYECEDGVSATRQIKQAFPTANIIIVTDYDDDGLREESQQAGACGYVLKENLLEIRRRLTKGPLTSVTSGDCSGNSRDHSE